VFSLFSSTDKDNTPKVLNCYPLINPNLPHSSLKKNFDEKFKYIKLDAWVVAGTWDGAPRARGRSAKGTSICTSCVFLLLHT